MLILLISSYCKMGTLPTIRSRVFVCCEQYRHARLYCWQWAHFTMGPNEQNQHFSELRQKVCLYIHVVVLLRCLPSLDGKLEHFITKKWKKQLPNLSTRTDFRRQSPMRAFVSFTLQRNLRAKTCAECNCWAIHRLQPVHVGGPASLISTSFYTSKI